MDHTLANITDVKEEVKYDFYTVEFKVPTLSAAPQHTTINNILDLVNQCDGELIVLSLRKNRW